MMASGAYFGITSGGWIMLNSSVASFPANVRIASSPPGCSERNLVTSSTSPFTTTQQSAFVLCFATSASVMPPPPPPAAAAPPTAAPPPPPPPPAPITPITASGAYFGITSGGWIMLNSSVASLPAKVRIASSPPGCSLRNFVTSSTSPFTTTQQSCLEVCLATSSRVKPPPPPPTATAPP